MLDGILININLLTLLAVGFGGASLGLYFAALNKFAPAKNIVSGIISFVVIGWSFYLPFAFASFATNEGADPLRFVGSMILWLIYTLFASGAYSLAAAIASERQGK